ncbi:MAG: DUF1254 domain-containing protein [Hyphomicrobiaceae bacterium]|nr:DUF1254 domain-containing protein [Hyphomicrobiaceae bacterium]
MSRFAWWTAAGLLVGGLVHIAAILTLPAASTNDAWARLSAFSTDGRLARLPRAVNGPPALPLMDPAMAHAACRFRLDQGPVRIRAKLPDQYWGLAVHDRRGAVRWSINDRALDNRPLDMLIAAPEHVAAIREALPPGLDGLVLVDWPHEDGFIVLRVLVPTETAAARVDAALDAATCAVDKDAVKP